jgi:aldehyde:ferredoxin oxidoreductase
MDSLNLCKFHRGVFTDLFAESAELLRHVTGWPIGAEDLRTTARRIVTVKKLFNIREGWTTAEATLARHFLSEGLALGPNREVLFSRERLEGMVQAYYAERGWGTDGRVPAGLIEELGLTSPVAANL